MGKIKKPLPRLGIKPTTVKKPRFFGVGALGVGALAGAGSGARASPVSTASGTNGNSSMGTAGRAARSGMAGGGSLPSIRAASKPSASENMNINQLLVVAVKYLASIDQTLKNQLELKRYIFSQQQMSGKEASAELQESAFNNAGANAGASAGAQRSYSGGGLMDAFLPGLLLGVSGLSPDNRSRILKGAAIGLGAALLARSVIKNLVYRNVARTTMKQFRDEQIAARKVPAEDAKPKKVPEADAKPKNNTQKPDKYVRTGGSYRNIYNPRYPQLYGESQSRMANAANEANRNAIRIANSTAKDAQNLLNRRAVAPAPEPPKAAYVLGSRTGGAAATARQAARKAAGKLPFGIGSIITFGFAYDYFTKGEYGKAALTALSGIAAFVPFYGTLASFALDAVVIGMEINEGLNPEEKSAGAGAEPAPARTPARTSTRNSSSGAYSTSTPFGGSSNLLDLIAGGESGRMGYDAANKGIAGDTLGGYPGLSKMTVNDVIKLQSEDKVFATGRYQIIPTTLTGLMAGKYGYTGVKGTDLYDASTQDKLATALINKRLKQGGDDPIKQQYALSQEFAAIVNPYTNLSYYNKVGNNRASIETSTIQSALTRRLLAQKSSTSPPNNRQRIVQGTPLPVVYDDDFFRKTVSYAVSYA